MELVEERDPQTHAILGAAMEVHTQLGHGFLEPVYQEALTKEFTVRHIPFVREAELVIERNPQTSCPQGITKIIADKTVSVCTLAGVL